MNLLFICRHNRFRSKVAEAIFNKLNRNKKNRVRSRGMIKDIDVAQNVIKALKEKVIALKSKKSARLTKKDIEWADMIVIVADNVNKGIFKKSGKKIIVWKISDVSQDNIAGIRKRVGIIEKRVAGLIKNLND